MSYDTRHRDDLDLREGVAPRDDAEVRDDADLRDDAEVRDDADLRDNAEVRDDADLRDNGEVRDDADLRDDAELHDDTPVREHMGPDGFGPAETGVAPVTQTGVAPVTQTGVAPVTQTGVSPVASDGDLSTRIWPQDQITGYQERWREVQLRFVDDPRAAADEAEALAAEMVDRFTAAVTERKRELDAWLSDAEQADTEQMRMAVRNYRRLLDRLFEV